MSFWNPNMKNFVCWSHHIFDAKELVPSIDSLTSVENTGKKVSLTRLELNGSRHSPCLSPSIHSSSLRSWESPLMFKCTRVYACTPWIYPPRRETASPPPLLPFTLGSTSLQSCWELSSLPPRPVVLDDVVPWTTPSQLPHKHRLL